MNGVVVLSIIATVLYVIGCLYLDSKINKPEDRPDIRIR